MTNNRRNRPGRRGGRGFVGLGNRRSRGQRNGPLPSGVKSEATTRLGCQTDPPSADANTVVTRRIQHLVNVSLAAVGSSFVATLSTEQILNSLPGSGQVLRIMKVTVWGPSIFTTPGTGANINSDYTLSVLDTLPNGDSASYIDRNVVGQARAAISYRPSYASRIGFLPSSSSTNIVTATVLTSGALPASTAADILFEVTTEVRWAAELDTLQTRIIMESGKTEERLGEATGMLARFGITT